MAAAQAATATAPISAPPPEELAPGVHLLPGAILPGRGPDGNTVVFDAPEGLVVIDTGRHAWHSDGILAFAANRERPIAAIVNTHWHLDHSSGNGRIKAIYPKATLYTTRAVDRALADGGFLARNLDSARPMLDDPKLDDVRERRSADLRRHHGRAPDPPPRRRDCPEAATSRSPDAGSGSA